jgi:colanic acid biosynthesis glycosyl transferase WcaI
MFFPSKLLGLLAASKPVITVASPESELAIAVREGGFGINVPPGEPARLAVAIDDLALDRERLHRFGVAGRAYVQQFERSAVLRSFRDELEKLSVETPRARSS